MRLEIGLRMAGLSAAGYNETPSWPQDVAGGACPEPVERDDPGAGPGQRAKSQGPRTKD
jgi:hypothetical protein